MTIAHYARYDPTQSRSGAKTKHDLQEKKEINERFRHQIVECRQVN